MDGIRYGGGDGRIMGRIISQLYSNRGFLTKEDLEVLEFLGNKGDHETKKAVLVDKNPPHQLQEYLKKNCPETWKKYNSLKLVVKK